MAYILGLIGSIVWILYMLDRMGINLGGLNPFHWRRRRAWAKKYGGDPIYAVEDPMEVAALFVVGAAKLDGDISAEQKAAILAQFSESFSLNERDAKQLLGSSSHLLASPQMIPNQLENLIKRHQKMFSADQVESLTAMMSATLTSTVSADQQQLIDIVRKQLPEPRSDGGTWG
ncbi:MAG: hypothetical protein AAF351_15725 [Pseudomonadota bacterium]